MSTFCDTFNPYLMHEVSSVVPLNTLHDDTYAYTGDRSSSSRLHLALVALQDEVHRLEGHPDICSSIIIHALDVLGAVQAELNLHREAAGSYRKIVRFDDMREYDWSNMSVRSLQYNTPCLHGRGKRSLEALFNLGLQLNKCSDYIAAEVALRRLIPLVRTKHGENSYQYRNSLEQLMYALRGQGCQEGVYELWREYCRSQDEEIAALLEMRQVPCSQQEFWSDDHEVDNGSDNQEDLQSVLDSNSETWQATSPTNDFQEVPYLRPVKYEYTNDLSPTVLSSSSPTGYSFEPEN